MYIKIMLILYLSLVLNAEELITPELIQRAEKKYGIAAKNRFVQIRDELLPKIKDKPDLIKLNFVNTRYNRIK